MPQWTVQSSNDNGQFVVVAEPGKRLTMDMERRFGDEPIEFDQEAAEDIRAKVGFAIGVAFGAPKGGSAS